MAKEAKEHHLTLNVRVPVQTIKAAAPGWRCIELGLPGTPVTLVEVEYPTGVKALTCNEMPEKAKSPGRWQLGLAAQNKSLRLAWQEPLTLPGNAPLVNVEWQISAMVDEKDVRITAELYLEDRRLQKKDWKLSLPAQVSVTAPEGLTWSKPDKQTPFHVLQASEATAERRHVTVTMRVPRTNAKVKIGPFHVLGAFQQTGTITVRMNPEASLGQRLVYTWADGVYQVRNTEAEAVFQYLAPPISEKNARAARAPLELEWRTEPVETQVTHEVRLHNADPGWEIDTTTRIQVTTRLPGIRAIDIKLPSPRPSDAATIGPFAAIAPGLGFPSNVPWASMWKIHSSPSPTYVHTIFEEFNGALKPVAQEGAAKVRVILNRSLVAKPTTLVVKGKIRVPSVGRRLHLELPRPLGTQDRTSTVTIQADDQTEILHGTEGAEEPIPDRRKLVMSADQAPAFVDLAWKPYHRELVVGSTLDILLHEQTAEVMQVLSIPRGLAAGAKTTSIVLKLPPGATRAPAISGGTIIGHNQMNQTLTVSTDGKTDLVLTYDLGITPESLLRVTPIAVAGPVQMDIKVRVWSVAGAKVAFDADQGTTWKEARH